MSIKSIFPKKSLIPTSTRRRIIYMLILLVPIFIVLFVVLRILLWEFSVGSLSYLSRTYGEDFAHILTEDLRKDYHGSTELSPYSRIRGVFEYTDECSVVYVVNVFPHSTDHKDDVLFNEFYKLVKLQNQWSVVGQEYDNTYSSVTHLTCK